MPEDLPQSAGAAFSYDATTHYYAGQVERIKKHKKMKKRIDKLSAKNRVVRHK